MDLALIVIDHFLIERRTDALCDAAMDLAIHNQRINQPAAVFRRHEILNAHLIGLWIYFDSCDVAGRRCSAEHGIVGFGGGELFARLDRQAAHFRIDRACDLAESERAVGAGNRHFAVFGGEISGCGFQ